MTEDITDKVIPPEQPTDNMRVPIALNEKGYNEIMSQLSRKQRAQFIRAANERGCTPLELLNELIKKEAATEPKLMMTFKQIR